MAANNTERNGVVFTLKQSRFIDEYVICLNATEAAVAAGYKKRSAPQQGNALLKNPKVMTEISLMLKERSEQTGITAEVVLEKLWRWANANIFDVLTYKRSGVGDNAVTEIGIKHPDDLPKELQDCVQEIAQTANGIRVKLVDKLAATRLVGLHLAMFTEKVDLSTKGEAISTAPPVVVQINHRRRGEPLQGGKKKG